MALKSLLSFKNKLQSNVSNIQSEMTMYNEMIEGIDEIETEDGAQQKVDAHKNEDGLHVTSLDREKWNSAYQTSAETKNTIDQLSLSNAQSRLTLLSAYDDIEAYHPKVVGFKEKWNGYLYWMAFTPYPKGTQAKENPHILVSDDMINWSEPNGFKNPLEPQPNGSSDKQYNSDTHMVYNDQLNRLEVYWRFVDDDAKTVTIFRKVTTDGKTWSDKEVAITGIRSDRDYISPAIIFEDNKYKMWCVTNGYKVIYSESTTGTEWDEFKDISIPMEVPMNLWHLDVIHTDVGYEMVVTAFVTGQDRNTMTLYHSVSEDNVTWSLAKPILKPSKKEFAWDNQGIYRACLMKMEGMYFLYYCGSSKKWDRGTGLSFGTDIYQLKGLDKNDVHILQNVRSVNMIYNAFLRNYGLQIAALQPDNSIWKACLRFSSANEVKFVNDFNENTLINLAVDALRTSNGIKFIGKSAYYNSNEFKVYEPGRASVVGIGAADFLRPKRVNDPTKCGGLEISSVVFEDNGIWDGTEREGAIRYDSARKKHVGFDGTEWHDLY
ncbi:hypothetical protein MOC76_16090 [Bacillus spizizenii]|uniref:hypothetical protein n=1 Tax=Bacillus spizizenii TaxID=96241 RepID=UPI00227E43C0|nr:hypothetical protein [Bacillus spizizenii]MCY8063813.1 hypothetical protein [Bacillus spizizenii]MCY8135282.1 hypothetical protein [Bacillus spizizenii]MCY8256858.1 hypothetical protein [Bacillus spizizenii]MCY9444194.1 hypothetical protein [Bacillus spizizenii]MEC0547902.1 hypothetical protein [Bacillus spizizenii]